MAYGDLQIYEKLLRTMRERRKSIEEAICYGGIPDFLAFREQRARLGELSGLEQELKALLEKVDQDD